MLVSLTLGALVLLAASVNGQFDPHSWPNRSGIVHLFEWKWDDIADECERFLAPHGYAGVQVSPVTENVIVASRPWWERYQPISYKLITRSGDEAQFRSMVRRCNNVGIRIYVDIIINHMSADHEVALGTGGSTADTSARDFPAVPYSALDFNPRCNINNDNDPFEVRNCELFYLHDLNQSVEWVRERIIDFLNHLIEIGVAGYRVDAARHMWPADLEVIYGAVRNLNTDHGFPVNARPFVTQEVIDFGDGGVSRDEYTHLGTVVEFRHAHEIGGVFRGNNNLRWLINWGEDWAFLPSHLALVFIDNHDNQRSDSDVILTYKEARQYKMATAFNLAHPFGIVRLMSSFAFTNFDQGPPQDANGNIISPSILLDGTCGNGWVCEHRWRQIHQMVDFRNTVHGTDVNNWWDNELNKIAFSRGNLGFIAFNGQTDTFNEHLQTGLPAGRYCDIISGRNINGFCSGATVNVADNGVAQIIIAGNAADGVLAIHVGSASRT